MDVDLSLIRISMTMIKLFILMLTGYLLHWRGWMNEKFTDDMGMLLVRVIFPALIISKTVTYFSFTEYSYWWVLPVCAAGFSLTGMAIGASVFGLVKDLASKREFMCACGFQNCGYLPMNLIIFSMTGLLADKYLIYLFLFVLGFNVLMWSLVPLFLTGGLKKGFRMRVLLNPPVVATCFSLIWVGLMGKNTIPAVVMDPVRQLGNAAFPLAMLVLGSYLYMHRAFSPGRKTPVFLAVAIKLFVFPVLVLAGLCLIGMPEDQRLFLFLQSLMPTAVSLVVIGSFTGSDNKFFSSVIFYSHVTAILTIPMWLYIFGRIF